METKELDNVISVTTVALEGHCTTIFLSLKAFLPLKIGVSQMSWDVKRTMVVEVWNEETKKWEILLGTDAFEYKEVEEAIRNKDIIGQVTRRASQVFGHLEEYEEYFKLLKEEEMDNYLESRVEYQKFEFKEDK